VKGFWTAEEDAKLVQLKSTGVMSPSGVVHTLPSSDVGANANGPSVPSDGSERCRSLTWAEIAALIQSRSVSTFNKR
jgi:hypothetical protein